MIVVFLIVAAAAALLLTGPRAEPRKKRVRVEVRRDDHFPPKGPTPRR